MFDTSFAQACLVITAAAVLMGRHETLTAARFMGKGFGRLVGTMQGFRAKYEQSVKGSALYELQSTVRKELTDLGNVSHDINMVSSNRLTYATASNLVNRKQQPPSPIMASSTGSPPVFRSSGASPAMVPATPTPLIGGQRSAVPPPLLNPASHGSGSHTGARGDPNEEVTLKLARLMLAEEQIRAQRGSASLLHDDGGMGSGSSNKNRSGAGTGVGEAPAEVSGVQIVGACISESLLNDSYEIAMRQQQKEHEQHSRRTPKSDTSV